MTVQRASGGIDYMNLAEFEIVTSESLHQPIRSDVFKWNTVSDEELSQECPEHKMKSARRKIERRETNRNSLLFN